MKTTKKDFNDFPKTDQFQIVDTIGFPHPYCIGSGLVTYAADKHYGILNEEVIVNYELNLRKPSCKTPGCILYYHEHENALVVEVTDDRELNDIPELPIFLQECAPMAQKLKYTGFAFKKGG